MSERKTLTITQVEEVKKVGDKQIPKLSFKAKDGDTELSYFTFKSSFFEAIKEGQTISADVETEQRGEYTNRKVVQIYVDGQPIGGKGQQGYRGKSPEELEQQARVMVLSYAKDLAVADKIKVVEIINQAEVFYNWVKKNEPTGAIKKAPTQEKEDADWDQLGQESQTRTDAPPTGKKVQNIAELKSLMMKHKIATHEAKEILSIKEFGELTDLDDAWERIKGVRGIGGV